MCAITCARLLCANLSVCVRLHVGLARTVHSTYVYMMYVTCVYMQYL